MKKVSLRLDFPWGGQHAAFWAAVDRGFFASRGLEVSITEGTGSGSTVQLVGTGQADFGFADSSTAAIAISQGVPVTVVAVIHGKGPTSAVFLEKQNIRTPKDLEGKTIAVTEGASGSIAWKVFVAKTGIDLSKIRVQNLPGATKDQALLAGTIDVNVTQGYFAIPLYASQGQKANELLFSDYGVTLINYGIVVNQKTVAEQPETVRNFLAAIVEGYQFAMAQPAEAVAGFARRIPIIEKDKATFTEVFIQQSKQFKTENTRNRPFGFQSIEDWNQTLDILSQSFGMTNRLSADRYFTNAYLPAQ